MKTTERSEIQFHQGETLLRLAGHYPTLADVIYETIQNALDSEAERIAVVIDHERRMVTVADDGVGATRDKFEKALKSVCCSVKDESKLGQFGMGLISPLGKCEEFTFTSTPRSNPKAYLCWTFNVNQLAKQSRLLDVPVEPLPQMYFGRSGSGKGMVPWRTEVKIRKFTKDRILSRLSVASLREGILERFAAAMQKLKAVVEIKIISAEGKAEGDKVVADAYEGKRLPVEYITDEDAGRTTFLLYVARRTVKGRCGKVRVGEDSRDFRISFSQFSRNSAMKSETVEALISGLFEGEILSEKARLDPSRKSFQLNDTLFGLCATIESWFEKTGRAHMEKAKEEMQDSRYQQLGLRSMRVIESLLERPEFAHLKEIVDSFSVGTIGSHHVRPHERILGQQDLPSVSVHGGEGVVRGNGSGGSIGEEPEKEHKKHIPLTVSGPKGRQRMLVKGNSLGLQFSYEEMEGSEKLWDLDDRCGILRFNTRHPLWAQCEVDDKALMKFQEHVALTALALQAAPDSWREQGRRIFDDLAPPIVFWLLEGDGIAGRKAGHGLVKYREAKKRLRPSSKPGQYSFVLCVNEPRLKSRLFLFDLFCWGEVLDLEQEFDSIFQ